jgi:hypothetical protein
MDKKYLTTHNREVPGSSPGIATLENPLEFNDSGGFFVPLIVSKKCPRKPLV